VRELPLLDTRTFYTCWGDVFAGACLLIAAATVVWTPIERRRRQKSS